MRKDGILYKHLIFSDLKMNGGAKSIASAMIANGFRLVYDSKLFIKEPIVQKNNNFMLLTSTKIYNKTLGIRFRRKALGLFNERPKNIHGENIRFLILDAGFKEGVDVFDIRYIHILETPVTKADEKQIIGRGTRFCGQKGLNFEKDKGWPLYVYQYRTVIPDTINEFPEKTLFDLFLKYSNLDPSVYTFAEELEKRAIQASVDLKQNAAIHNLDPNFKPIYNEIETLYPMKDIMVKYDKKDPINCRNGCKGKAVEIPLSFMLIVWYMTPKSTHINQKRPKPYLCSQIIENKEYCYRLNKAWRNPDSFILKNEQKIKDTIGKLPKKEPLLKQIKDMESYTKSIIDSYDLPPEPPKQLFNYGRLKHFVFTHFKHQTWDKPVVENLCETKAGKKEEAILSFTPSQDFVRYYFQPKSVYKGLLLWQSTGTGKTCTGIATATTSFEKEGYNILWVTRHTLRGDIWKNMFDQICSLVLRDHLPKNFTKEDAIRHPFNYISDKWITPITYKQFSNLLLKRNQFYNEMVKRNGSTDPLKKTLIIIDEAHKLLSSDLPPQERPDFKILKKFIQHSYDVSGKDSVRLLLMTATPYTTNPIHMIQLINLLKEKNHLPEDYDAFKDKYLNEKGSFKNPIAFIEELSGYISYLNREKDIRQFAYPILETIDVPMSVSNINEFKMEYNVIEDDYNDAKMRVDKNKEAIRIGKAKVKAERDILNEKCKKIKDREEKKLCKEDVEQSVQEFSDYIFKEANENIIVNEEKMKLLKMKMKQIKNKVKDYRNNDLSQERVLYEKCLKQKLDII